MSRRRQSAPLGNRLGRAMLGLFLIGMGLSALSDQIGMGLFLLIGGLIMLGVMMSSAQTSTPGFAEQEDPFRKAERPARRYGEDPFAGRDFSLSAEPMTSNQQGGSTRRATASRTKASGARLPGRMHRVAAKAVRKAGQDPDQMVVAPVDVGILVYEDRNATPTLYREARLPEEAEYVRPFMLLRSPRHAKGNIRFELYDGDGEQRFVNEHEWELQAGETFVYPSTWLPLHSIEDTSGEWTMRVYAANMLLAVHEFMWPDTGGGEFRQFLNGDGEISENLAEELSSARLGRLSLEDLLDDQEGGLIELDPDAEAAARRNEMINRQHRQR